MAQAGRIDEGSYPVCFDGQQPKVTEKEIVEALTLHIEYVLCHLVEVRRVYRIRMCDRKIDAGRKQIRDRTCVSRKAPELASHARRYDLDGDERACLDRFAPWPMERDFAEPPSMTIAVLECYGRCFDGKFVGGCIDDRQA